MELKLRSKEMISPIESIYFGGGSPSLINPKSIKELIDLTKQNFTLYSEVEITLEVNPDDVNESYLI